MKRTAVAFSIVAVVVLVGDRVVAQESRGVVFEPPPGAGRGLSGETVIYEKSFAVVIGIDAYVNDNMPDLHGAVRDATAVATALEERGIAVKKFLDDEATLQEIKRYLGDELPGLLGEKDRVLVYFAGHGVSTGTAERAMGYLMPVDADAHSPRATGISMRELQAWFADYPAKHVMFVADACYSGLALSTRATPLPPQTNEYLRQITSKPVRMALVAGGAGEEANEWRGQGLFTTFFLEAIGGAADTNQDGLITSDEIAAFVKPNVSQTAMSEFRANQNPQIGRRGEGEFVFLNPHGVPTPEPPPSASEPLPGGAEASAVTGGNGAPGAAAPQIIVINDPGKPERYNRWGHVTFWTGTGLGALGFGALGLSIKYGNDASTEADAGKQADLEDSSVVWSGVMWGCFGVGAALMATGIGLWIAAPDDEEQQPTAEVALAPLLDGETAALALVGRW